MNKNRFRIVFNTARGAMMIVGENVKSHTAAAKSGLTSSAEYLSLSFTKHITVSMRPLAFSVMLALGLIGVASNPMVITLAHANIIADPTAPEN